MNHDQVSRTIQEVEQRLAHDDPALMKRFQAVQRAEIATALTVFLLLAGGAVLLTVGFATLSWPTWIAGVLALLASFAVDEHHQHTLRRTS